MIRFVFLRDHFGCRWKMVWRTEERGCWEMEVSHGHPGKGF